MSSSGGDCRRGKDEAPVVKTHRSLAGVMRIFWGMAL